jgi:hypothetical protein
MERKPLMTYASIGILGSTSAIITLIAVGWSIMAFRADNAQVVQAFNDFAFYMFLYTWPPFGLWMAIIAIAIFRDINPDPIYPRWVAYYNIMAALLMAPATLIGAFKTGPLAYNGFLSFWVFVIEFLIWMLVMITVTFKAYAKLERRAQATAAAQVPPPLSPPEPREGADMSATVTGLPMDAATPDSSGDGGKKGRLGSRASGPTLRARLEAGLALAAEDGRRGRLSLAGTSVTFNVHGAKPESVTVLLDRDPPVVVDSGEPAEVTIDLSADMADQFSRGAASLGPLLLSGGAAYRGPVRKYLIIDPVLRGLLSS